MIAHCRCGARGRVITGTAARVVGLAQIEAARLWAAGALPLDSVFDWRLYASEHVCGAVIVARAAVAAFWIHCRRLYDDPHLVRAGWRASRSHRRAAPAPIAGRNTRLEASVQSWYAQTLEAAIAFRVRGEVKAA